jgi:K+-transporting ATPase ATPase A chain
MLFVCFLLGVIVIVGGLTYSPALALGPIIDHFQIAAGILN